MKNEVKMKCVRASACLRLVRWDYLAGTVAGGEKSRCVVSSLVDILFGVRSLVDSLLGVCSLVHSILHMRSLINSTLYDMSHNDFFSK